MLIVDIVDVPTALSLGVIAVVLAASIGLSLLFPKAAGEAAPVEHPPLDSDEEDGPIPALEAQDESRELDT